jgi:very-short-patch-repair endonuclease
MATVQQFNRKPRRVKWKKACKHCDICFGPQRRNQMTSEYEIEASRVLQKVAPEARQITQPVLVRRGGAVDFMLVWEKPYRRETSLVVEVDGEQHFTKIYKGTTPTRQQQVDRRKEDALAAKGWRVLRLHYHDKRYWERHIKRARTLVENNKSREEGFVLYTKSYNELGLEDKVPWEKKKTDKCRE